MQFIFEQTRYRFAPKGPSGVRETVAKLELGHTALFAGIFYVESLGWGKFKARTRPGYGQANRKMSWQSKETKDADAEADADADGVKVGDGILASKARPCPPCPRWCRELEPKSSPPLSDFQ